MTDAIRAMNAPYHDRSPSPRLHTSPGAPGALVAFALTLVAAVGCTGESPLHPGEPEDSSRAAQALPADEGASLWASVADMTAARSRHAAARLLDGRVLIAGGLGSGSSILASAELFDPATGTFSTTGSMSTPRRNFTATRLLDGRVLVVGGYNTSGSQYLASAELYDPASGTWSSAGSLFTARYRHTATLLSDGRVLVAGGENTNYLSLVELYTPAPPSGAGSWASGPSLPSARARHTATLIADGAVLVSGGESSSGDLDAATIYDPATNAWLPAASMAGARSLHTSTLLPDGDVLVAGTSANAERYRVATNTWISVGPMPYNPTTRSHATAALPSGAALVTGGQASTTGAALFYPESDTWAMAPPMLAQRVDHVAVPLIDGRVLLAGGTDTTAGAPPKSSAEVWDGAALGAPCGAADECRSAYCVDGICCDGPCSGTCESCTMAAGAPADGVCALLSGDPCDDGDACTVNDACLAGACEVGNKVLCTPGPCEEASACDQVTGACVTVSKPPGTPCAGGVCIAGVCVPDAEPGPGPGASSSSSGGGPPRPVDDSGCTCQAAGRAAPGTSHTLALLLFASTWCARRRSRHGSHQ